MKVQPALVTPSNGAVTPGIHDALTQMLTQPGPSSITVHVVEQVRTLIEVNTNTQGNVIECRIVKGSGSDSLDSAARDRAKGQV